MQQLEMKFEDEEPEVPEDVPDEEYLLYLWSQLTP